MIPPSFQVRLEAKFEFRWKPTPRRDLNPKSKSEFTLRVGMKTKVQVVVVAQLQVRMESELQMALQTCVIHIKL
ncbi:hypothetical protein PRUPE_3G091400 [Prunus persica]|uniref:Uncharacterized protein n=1 Tax=Prunus persica TaxID=3760 RepID=A0A251PXM2_PRUPE|nr:hypothetical protein PRUPE_3G091400 [Prunus persica]